MKKFLIVIIMIFGFSGKLIVMETHATSAVEHLANLKIAADTFTTVQVARDVASYFVAAQEHYNRTIELGVSVAREIATMQGLPRPIQNLQAAITTWPVGISRGQRVLDSLELFEFVTANASIGVHPAIQQAYVQSFQARFALLKASNPGKFLPEFTCFTRADVAIINILSKIGPLVPIDKMGTLIILMADIASIVCTAIANQKPEGSEIHFAPPIIPIVIGALRVLGWGVCTLLHCLGRL
jgi:hypothetical protein